MFTPANQACPFPCSQSRVTPAFHPARPPTRRGAPSPPPHPASGEVGDAAGPAPGPARRLRADVMLRAGRCGGSCKSAGPELVRKEPAGRATLALCPSCPWRTPASAWWTFFSTILFWVLWGIIPRVSPPPLCAVRVCLCFTGGISAVGERVVDSTSGFHLTGRWGRSSQTNAFGPQDD